MKTDTPRTRAAIEAASDPDAAPEVCDLCEQLERETVELKSCCDLYAAQVQKLRKEICNLVSALKHIEEMTNCRACGGEVAAARAREAINAATLMP